MTSTKTSSLIGHHLFDGVPSSYLYKRERGQEGDGNPGKKKLNTQVKHNLPRYKRNGDHRISWKKRRGKSEGALRNT